MAVNSDLNVHHLVICANFFVRKDGRYLMIRRSEKKAVSPGFVHTIGGKIDEREHPLQAAKRELREEAGIDAQNIKLEAIVLEILPRELYDNDWLIYYFSGDYLSGELKKTDEGELMWLTLDQIRKSKVIPAVRETVDLQLDPEKGIVIAKFIYDKNMNILHKEIEIC